MIILEKKPPADLAKAVNATMKAGGIYGKKARIVLVVDRSVSMNLLFENGQVQCVVDRAVGLGLEFDDDGRAEVYAFHNRAFPLPDVGVDNLSTYVEKYIKPIPASGTSYAPVCRAIVAKYKSGTGSGGGMLSGLFSKKVIIPTYVLFITDGDNDDHAETEKIIREASGYPIFWQFVGIGSLPFTFLRKLDQMTGRTVDNANFFSFSGAMKDEELYQALLNEYPTWLKDAKAAGIL